MTSGPQRNATPFSSNAERLSMREWVYLLLALVVVGIFAGPVWKKLEVFQPSPDYRIPYGLSEDYWLFQRLCNEVGKSDKHMVIGDSFVWGQFVKKEETLSSYLDREAGSARHMNLGLDGTHPLALEGLIEHHCQGLRNRRVILHLNLLWVSSPQADLQSRGGPGFNHPRLVPQFFPDIPVYEAPFSERVGVVAARHLPVLGWAQHLRTAYFSNRDLGRWSLENPYLNPLRQITLTLPDPEDDPHPEREPWSAGGANLRAPPWVDLEISLQWSAFQRLVETLEARENDLFVLVGPLNEHMLEPSNRQEYQRILTQVETWLHNRGLPFYIPPVLPSELYGDLSHPLPEGYAILARDLWERLPASNP